MTSPYETLAASVPLLPPSVRAQLGRLLEPIYLERIADRLLAWHRDGVPAAQPPPYFAAECTPPLGTALCFFTQALKAWDVDATGPGTAAAFAESMAAAGCPNLLLLLGQRRTPASLTDCRAIPPPREVLLAAAEEPCGPHDPLTSAARALAKHVHRSPEVFWGKVQGPVADKSRAARAVVERILEHASWWNVFGHYKHDTIFEARVATGHGARWGRDGTVFIGFVEPFDADRRLQAPQGSAPR
jgi:hypothetical protein